MGKVRILITKAGMTSTTMMTMRPMSIGAAREEKKTMYVSFDPLWKGLDENLEGCGWQGRGQPKMPAPAAGSLPTRSVSSRLLFVTIPFPRGPEGFF